MGKRLGTVSIPFAVPAKSGGRKKGMTVYKRFLACILSLSLLLGTSSFGAAAVSAETPRPPSATSDQQAMDKLLAPIALYPDALLAQVLAGASSPQQVTQVNAWLQQNSQLQGTDLQQAAEQAGFDAAFIALVLFPDVLTLMTQNLPWTTELGNAFTSNQSAVLDSVQRLRAQAQAAGNLKTTPQQEVTTQTQNGQQVIVIQPANPQIVYVPQYNPQVVYVSSPPSSGDVATAALIGFGLGIALGAAINNSSYGYYGWGAWGMRWNTRAVVVRGGVWRAPLRPRYPYVRPVPHYRPPVNVYAPRYSSVNVNVNRVNNVNVNRNNTNLNQNNVNVNRNNVNAYGKTPRPATLPAAPSAPRGATSSTPPLTPRGNPASAPSSLTRGGTAPAVPPAKPVTTTPYTPSSKQGGTVRPLPAAGTNPNNGSRNRAPSSVALPSTPTRTASPARQMETGAPTSAFSSYQKGSAQQAASARGRSSANSAIPRSN